MSVRGRSFNAVFYSLQWAFLYNFLISEASGSHVLNVINVHYLRVSNTIFSSAFSPENLNFSYRTTHTTEGLNGMLVVFIEYNMNIHSCNVRYTSIIIAIDIQYIEMSLIFSLFVMWYT
jgi:hypothetical protein